YWDRFYKATVRHGVCGICGSACAFKAYVEGDGYLVDMKGKEGDLESQGKLCAKGNAGIWYAYDPDRLKYPLKRTNPEKGIDVDPEWVRISWDEALDLVANKFLEIKEKYGGHSIIFLGHPPYKPWLTRLAYALGSPNYISHLDTCVITNVLVRKFTMHSPTFVHDVKNARYILCFGWDQPAKGKVVYTHQYSEAVRNKAKIVVLNPLYTPTASKASRWIPIKPGTDLAFALAMMNVIINEGLYDEDYVNKYTNFPDHEDEIRSWVQQYTPEWAEDITEVPADTIRTVAREFATTKPSIALTHKRDAAGPNYANSWKLAHAIVILNALVGAIDNVGGVILPRTFKMPDVNKIYSMPPAPSVTEKADGKHMLPLLNKLGHGIFSTLIGNILEEKPYPIKAALVCNYNILSFPNPKKAIEAFKKLEFLAVVDILPSEMALLADVVLPDTTYWETSGLSLRSYNALYPQIAVKDAIIKPMYDVKSHTWIIYQIGKRVAPEYFNFSLSELSNEMVRRAGIANSVGELKSMAVNGLYTPPGACFKPLEKLKSLVSQGKKIQIYGEFFAKYGYDPLPSWEPKREEKSLEYPYYLIVTRSAVHRHGKTANIPWLHEICPENCVLIHPEEAESLGIEDLDWVYVESRYGKIKVKALRWPGIRRDCVCVSHGFGHWSRYMRVAYGWGANDGDLIPDQSIDDVLSRRDPTANALMSDVCVKVYRA
ncbi:MAG: hypothetical protein DRJ69_02510, partial [Thermoprotei archaeon]